MACLGAGRDSEVERIERTLRTSAGEQTESGSWASDALSLVEGFTAFWRQDYQRATGLLYSARHIVNRFGGSHAQRDIIDQTLTEAALRGNMHDLAEGLVNERLALKPHSAGNRRMRLRSQYKNAQPST